MEKNCCYLNILLFLLSLNVVLQSTKSEMNDLPPTNITARMADMFHIILNWEPPAANCTPGYRVVVSSLGSSQKIDKSTKDSFLILNMFPIYRWFDPNDYFTTEIKVHCDGKIRKWANSHMQLIPGNEKISVKNVSCVWHYMDYIDCTWQPGVDTPPNVQYRLLYWEEDTSSGSFPESIQLQDLLRTGTECQEYFPPDGMYLGCKFKYEYNIRAHKELLFMVTDTSYSAKPFLHYRKAIDIAKLKSPIITYVSEPTNNSIYVNWTQTTYSQNLEYEVLVFTDRWSETLKVSKNLNTKVHIPNSDDTLTVKVRVQFSLAVADSSFWSDWSKEWTVQGKDKNTTSILLLTLIPAAVIVVAVILLVYLKRLKILIFPPIPRPGKKFQYDLQNWLNRERPANVYDKPEEDISPVSMDEV